MPDTEGALNTHQGENDTRTHIGLNTWHISSLALFVINTFKKHSLGFIFIVEEL